MTERSEALRNMITGLEQGAASQAHEPVGLAAVRAAIEELKYKLTLAELVARFYGELPVGKRLMVDAVLPAELKALLAKGKP
jgi:hypothetical protein